MILQNENHAAAGLKTLVYQSFRTQNVPVWMPRCMASVKDWADSKNYAYEFLDDRFFGYAPDWFRSVINDQRHLVADFARLELADLYLGQGWDRVIWIDADVFICDINHFDIDGPDDFLFCRELWMTRRNENIAFSNRINNSIMMFAKGNDFLAFYRDACQKIVKSKKQDCWHTEIGTKFLSGIPYKLPLLRTVACLSPLLLLAFSRKNDEIIAAYCNEFSAPIYAINLCLTFRGRQFDDVVFNDDVYLSIIEHFDSKPTD